eukprot:s538_g29.t1
MVLSILVSLITVRAMLADTMSTVQESKGACALQTKMKKDGTAQFVMCHDSATMTDSCHPASTGCPVTCPPGDQLLGTSVLKELKMDRRPTEPYNRYGIKLNIVQKSVPVVEMATDSIFHPNASWLLQDRSSAASGSSSKADGLYEYYQDRWLVMMALSILLALRDKQAAHNLECDIKDLDESLSEPLADVLQGAFERCEDEAISRNARGESEGRGDDRSASKRKAYEGYTDASSPSRRKGKPPQTPRVRADLDSQATSRSQSRQRHVVSDDVYEGGWGSGRGGQDRKDWSDWGWQDWSSMGWDYNYRGGGGGRYDDSHDYGKPKKPGHGVKMNIVNSNVPVVELATHSIFHGNASWLLQAATGSCGKADGLYEYCQDKEVTSICVRDLRIARQSIEIEINHVRCSATLRKDRPDIVAVGTNGKRSVMFALCVMLALLDTKAANALERDIRDTDASLSEPLAEVLAEAFERSEDPRILNNARGGGGRGGSWNGGGGAGSWNNSYKATYREASPTPPPRRPRGGRGRKARGASPGPRRQVVPDVDDLDQQLEAFMAPDPSRGRD